MTGSSPNRRQVGDSPERIRALRRLLLQRIATDTVPRGERDAPEVQVGDDQLLEVLDLRRDYDAALRARDQVAVARIRARARELLAADAEPKGC